MLKIIIGNLKRIISLRLMLCLLTHLRWCTGLAQLQIHIKLITLATVPDTYVASSCRLYH